MKSFKVLSIGNPDGQSLGDFCRVENVHKHMQTNKPLVVAMCALHQGMQIYLNLVFEIFQISIVEEGPLDTREHWASVGTKF